MCVVSSDAGQGGGENTPTSERPGFSGWRLGGAEWSTVARWKWSRVESVVACDCDRTWDFRIAEPAHDEMPLLMLCKEVIGSSGTTRSLGYHGIDADDDLSSWPSS